MTDEERRISDALVQIDQFGQDNAGVFPAVGTARFATISNIVNQLQSTGGEQMAAIGESGQQVEIKGTRREAMRAIMSRVAETARGMEYAFDGISDLFRMPRNRNDADLLSAARAFITDGAAYETNFKEYGLQGWIPALTTAADEFEASLGSTASAQADRAEATAEMHDWVVQGMRARRTLDPIVKNVFADDVGKLAAWLQASHIERPPKKKP